MKRFSAGRCALLAFVLSLAACATQPPSVPDAPLPFDVAVAQATDRLVAQLPAFSALPLLAARNITHDPSLDVETGQQTGATRTLDSAIARNIAERHPKLTVLPFQSSHLADARYLLVSTMAREAGQHAGALRIEMALVERESGTVVAQTSALASNDGLDHAPLPYYRDSPVLVKDRVVEGYIRTAATRAGKRGDAYYLERIAVATAVNEATELYNQARYREALGEYRSALAVPAGEQMRVLNGIYLANVKLGQSEAAEASVRPRRGDGHRLSPAQREVPLQPRQRRVLRRSAHQHALSDVAAADRAAKRRRRTRAWTSSGTPAAPAGVAPTKPCRCSARSTSSAGSCAKPPNWRRAREAIGMGFRQNIIGTRHG